MIKVYNGTSPDQHLCRTCAAAVIRIEGGQEVTVCREMPAANPDAVIRRKVSACSSYQDSTAARAMNQFSGQAWFLDMDEEGSPCWQTPADRNDNPGRYPRRVSRRRKPVTTLPDDPGDPGPTVQ